MKKTATLFKVIFKRLIIEITEKSFNTFFCLLKILNTYKDRKESCLSKIT